MVAISRNGGYRYTPHPPEKLAEVWEADRQRSTSNTTRESREGPREIPPITQARSDWSESLYWEDANVGDAMPSVSMNLTVQRLVMVAGAMRNFDYRHHDTLLTQKSGVEEM